MFIDRLSSGAKRTFWSSSLELRSEDYAEIAVNSWTSDDIDRVVDHLGDFLKRSLQLPASQPIAFQVGTLGQHNFSYSKRDPSKGPRRVRYLSLCAVSGRYRATMGIGCDIHLPAHVREFLDGLPICVGSWV